MLCLFGQCILVGSLGILVGKCRCCRISLFLFYQNMVHDTKTDKNFAFVLWVSIHITFKKRIIMDDESVSLFICIPSFTSFLIFIIFLSTSPSFLPNSALFSVSTYLYSFYNFFTESFFLSSINSYAAQIYVFLCFCCSDVYLGKEFMHVNDHSRQYLSLCK
jgi:hypothetical protein